MIKYKTIWVSAHVYYTYIFWLLQPFLFLNNGSFDIFKCSIVNDHFRHFNTLIQTMSGLYITFETIKGLCTKILNHRGIKYNLP